MIPLAAAPLTEIVQIAVQARPTEPFSLNPLEPRSEDFAAVRQLLEVIPEYSGPDLQRSIAAFIKELCGEESTELESLKNDTVFTSRSQKVVVKVFIPKNGEDDLYKFVWELSGHKMFEELELQKGKLVTILGVGKCTLEGKHLFLLAMQLAPGIEIKKYIDAIFIKENRHNALTHCQHVLHQLGEVFAEVHNRKKVNFRTSQELVAYANKGTLERVRSYFEKYRQNGGEHVVELQSLFAQKLAEAYSTILTVAAGHGDSHLKNFLHDPVTNQITIIDTSRAHNWTDPQGAPLYPTHLQDVARTIDDIAKWVLHHADDRAVIADLTSSFKAGYFNNCSLISPAELDLAVSLCFLSRLKSAVAWPQDPDPASQPIKKRIHDYYLAYLLNLTS